MKKQQNDRAESGSSNSLLWGYSLLTIAVLLLSIDAVLILEVSNLGAWYFSLLSARDIFCLQEISSILAIEPTLDSGALFIAGRSCFTATG